MRALLERETHERYSGMLEQMDTLEREHRLLLSTIKNYFGKYKVDRILSDELRIFFNSENPGLAKNEIYQTLLDQIARLQEVNTGLIMDTLAKLADWHCCCRVAREIMPVINGQQAGAMEKLTPIIEEYGQLTGRVTGDDPNVSTKSWAELREQLRTSGMPWMLAPLQRIFGPLVAPSLGHVFARSETGKSAFIIHLATWLAYTYRASEGTPVLYLGNEESADAMRARFYCASTGVSAEKLDALDPEQVEETYRAKGGDRIKIVEGVTSLAAVERYVAENKPRIVMIDQGPKLTLPGDYATHERRQLVYFGLRTLANRHRCAILSAGQASSTAEGKKWLGLNDIDGSKVGIPGECDWIIGIGRYDDQPDYRFFTVLKNKLTGLSNCGDARFTALWDKETCRYKDL